MLFPTEIPDTEPRARVAAPPCPDQDGDDHGAGLQVCDDDNDI